MDAELKAGQVVEPRREMHCSWAIDTGMVAARADTKTAVFVMARDFFWRREARSGRTNWSDGWWSLRRSTRRHEGMVGRVYVRMDAGCRVDKYYSRYEAVDSVVEKQTRSFTTPWG